jgi:hypothetical protein
MQVNLKTKQLHPSAGGMSPAQQRDLNIRPCRSNLKLNSYIHQLEVWVLANRDLKAVWYITNCDGFFFIYDHDYRLLWVMFVVFYNISVTCISW